MRLNADFAWPAIFAVCIKTQLYGYFYCNDKSPAILLILLVLALLLRELSTMGGVSSMILKKDNCDFSLSVQQFDLTPPPPHHPTQKKNNQQQQQQQTGEIYTIPNYSTPPFPDQSFFSIKDPPLCTRRSIRKKGGITALIFEPLAFQFLFLFIHVLINCYLHT